MADSEAAERKSIAPRLEQIEGARIGLFDNGKPAAEPLLDVVEERLEEAYPSVTVDRYAVDHLNRIKNDAEMDAIEAWADEELDACIGAIGDCGSCTKYLVYGIESAERSETPGVGIVDEGFALDWDTNARDFGRELRYYTMPAISEVIDRDRFREQLTVDVLDEILDELTRPPTPEERAAEDAESESETTVVAGGDR
ncbi:hypothetical protein C493_12434 [Natronolimnohabitans innermongolicus JCM 12255]|uniref:UGSC-like domain-containing protein n=1 Tax=Natronolimnohabitans innermongolicus JCM 12255 TaxID=1227499 RepID=L9X2G3_9EURY|nr:hypothetical protein C493_12434 [Natronolimnohabitans innermongolicus JCM 12255]